MEKQNSNRKKCFLFKLPSYLRLYLSQFGISIIIWIINKTLFKDIISNLIREQSINLTSFEILETSPLMIFVRFLITLITVYLIILVISYLTNNKFAQVLFLSLSLFVALAGSNNLGKGLLTYNWGENLTGNTIHNIALLLSSQLEWLGGSVLVSSISRGEISLKKVLNGLMTIILSLIILVVLITPI